MENRAEIMGCRFIIPFCWWGHSTDRHSRLDSGGECQVAKSVVLQTMSSDCQIQFREDRFIQWGKSLEVINEKEWWRMRVIRQMKASV